MLPLDWREHCERYPHAGILLTPWYWEVLEYLIFNRYKIIIRALCVLLAALWVFGIVNGVK